ncbi:MAG TPA: putative Ig domain-containing protein, partial [Candidatus Thermoplasmatota archaeon]
MRTPSPALRRLSLPAALLLLWSCSGGDGTGPQDDLTAVANVTVSPNSGTVNVGATLPLQALVTNVRGSPLTNPVTWSSSPQSVATVTQAGVVTGVSAGTATITASAGGRSGTATITVNDPRPPAAPSNVTAVPFSNTAVDVSWTDNSDNETGFTIEREPVAPAGPAAASGAAVFAVVGTVGANVTTFRDTGLSPNTAYRYRVSASNGNGSTAATTTVQITTHTTLEVTTAALAEGTLNVAYAQNLQATGGTGTFAWTQTAGTMPPGLALQTAGTISGTPTQIGAFALTLTVTSGGQSVAREYGITINEQILPPEVVTTALPDGSVGNAYSATLQAQKGDGTYAWALQSGSLPAGLVLASNGTVTGVPTVAGTSNFTVQVQSASLSGTGAVSLTIHPPLAVTTTNLPTGVVGAAYAAQLAATGGDGSYTWSALSGLPEGIALAAGGALSGAPGAAGTSNVTFRVTSGDGQSVDVQLALTVFDVLEVTTTSLADGQVGQAYSVALAASGGSGVNTWSVTAGSLPPGLALTAGAGLISGTPTAVGTSTFTVQASSSDGQSATRELQIEVTAGPVTVTTTSLAGGQVG